MVDSCWCIIGGARAGLQKSISYREELCWLLYQALILMLGGICLSVWPVHFPSQSRSITYYCVRLLDVVRSQCLTLSRIRSQRLLCAEGWVHQLRAIEQTTYSSNGFDGTLHAAHKSRRQSYRLSRSSWKIKRVLHSLVIGQ